MYLVTPSHNIKGNMTFRQRRFGKKHSRRFGNFFMPKRPVLSWFWFWFFSANWLGPVCRIPVCRILELKKNDKTIDVGLMESIKRAWDMSPFPLGTGRFGKDVSAKNLRDVSAKKIVTFQQIFHAETSRIILVLFLVFYKLVRSSL